MANYVEVYVYDPKLTMRVDIRCTEVIGPNTSWYSCGNCGAKIYLGISTQQLCTGCGFVVYVKHYTSNGPTQTGS
jgi:hypothetical protein